MCEAIRGNQQPEQRQPIASRCCWHALFEHEFKTGTAAIAQLAARRSHNPKIVSLILTRRTFQNDGPPVQVGCTQKATFRKSVAMDSEDVLATS